MKNPIRELRKKTGKKRSEFSLLLGASYMAVYRAEEGLGDTLPQKLVKALREVGLNAEHFEEQYKRWKQDQKDAEKLKQVEKEVLQ